MKRTESIVGIALILALAIFTGSTVMVSRQFRLSNEYSSLAEHSRTRLIAVQALIRSLLSAETGQRGFLLTGNPIYLDAYTQSVSATRTALIGIAAESSESPDQRAEVEHLTVLADAKLAELQQTIALEQVHQHPQALAIIQTGEGKRMMGEIQRITGALLIRERELLVTRSAVIRRSQRSTEQLFWIGEGGMAALFVHAFFYKRHVSRAKRKLAESSQWNEEQLRDSERHFREITDHVPAIVAQYDLNHRCLFVNAEITRLYGTEVAAFVGKTQQEIRGRDNFLKVAPALQAVLEGEPQHFETMMKIGAKDRWLQQTLVPKRDASGKMEGYYSMTVDFTLRKDAELKLQQKERMLRTIADSLPVLIAYADKNETIQFLNSTYKTWMNIDPIAAVGRQHKDVIGAALYEERLEQIRQVQQGNVVNYQTVLESEAGPRHLQVTYVPDICADGEVAGAFALSTDITAMKTVEKQLDEVARRDILTGLPNRRQFEEELERLLLLVRRDPAPFAMMFLDIDHFKTINDTRGHAIGDAALKHLATKVKESIRGTDFVARLGGDEFVVLLPSLHNRGEAESVARKILRNVRSDFRVADGLLNITTSIGVAYAPNAGLTGEALLSSADKALYRAKDAGRDGFSASDCAVVTMLSKHPRARPKQAVG